MFCQHTGQHMGHIVLLERFHIFFGQLYLGCFCQCLDLRRLCGTCQRNGTHGCIMLLCDGLYIFNDLAIGFQLGGKLLAAI